MVKSLRTRRAVVAATTAVSLAAGASAPVQASDVQDAYYAHTRHCIGLFFSDKAAHGAECLPNLSATVWTPTTSENGADPVPVVIEPPPPPPPVVVPDSSYPDIGSGYPNVDSGYPVFQ